MFAPDSVFAEVPAVVAPDNDDCVFGKAELVESGDDLSNLGIGVADAGGVVLTDFDREIRIGVGVLSPPIVFHKFTGAVPSGFA